MRDTVGASQATLLAVVVCIAVARCGGATGADSGTVPEPTDGATDASAGTAGSSGCDPIVFEDPVLEAAVREAAGGQSGPISEEAAATVARLVVTGVSSLEGLQCLPSLYYLSVSDSRIESFESLARLPSLDFLLIEDCSAPFDELETLSTVAHLTLRGDAVTSVGFVTRLTRLVELRLRYTSVADISPVAALADIRVLDVTGSPVADLSPLAGLSELCYVYAADSAVASLAPLDRTPAELSVCSCPVANVAGTPLAATAPDATISDLCSLGWQVIWQDAGAGVPELSCGPVCAE